MTIKPFKSTKGNWLFAVLPLAAKKVFIGGKCHACQRAGTYHCAHADTCGSTVPDLKVYSDNDKLIETQELPVGDYTVIGCYGIDMTEEQAAMVVQEVLNRTFDGMEYLLGYRDYKYNTPNVHCKTAFESLYSLLESIGVPLKNPYGEKEPKWKVSNTHTEINSDYRRWSEAQSKLTPLVAVIKLNDKKP